MLEPATPTAATAAVAGIALLAALPGVDAAVVLGSFSGAVVFVMTATELKTWQKLVLFIPAFFGGLLCAQVVANIIASLLPEPFNVGPGVGALIAATMVVRILIWLLDQNLTSVIAMLRGGAKK